MIYVLGLALWSARIPAPTAGAIVYGVTPLTVTAGAFRPAQINDHREVVGNVQIFGPSFSLTPALWLPQAKYGLAAGTNDLSAQSGFDGDRAFGINNLGQVVGTGHAPTFQGSQHPVTWLPAPAHGRPAGWSLVDTVLGDANRINNAGEITGHYHNLEQARVWLPTAAHGMPAGATDIATPGWGFGSDINESGQVAGRDFDPNTNSDSGFLFLPQPAYGRAAGVHFLPAGSGTAPGAINNKGLIAGSYDTPPVNGVSTARAFIWRPSTTVDGPAGFFDLGGVPADATYWDLYAADINDLGQVVGTRSIKTPDMSTSTANAFLWTRTGGMVDLNTLIDPNSGWVLRTAFSINGVGDIVGTGTLNGVDTGYMLTVPEPSAVMMLVLTPIVHALRRRRCASAQTRAYD